MRSNCATYLFSKCIGIVLTAFLLPCLANAAVDFNHENGMVSLDSSKDKVNFIKRLYSDYVFGGEDFSPVAHKYCTPELRKQLSDAYEYDCYDGECYAVWLFRSDVQDGPSDECRLTGITELNEGWFLVNFIDMGYKGSIKIKFTENNGSFMMEKIDNKYYM